MKQDDIRSCRDLEDRLAPYVDDEIAPDARRSADAHMNACPPCRLRMESERVARDVLREHLQVLELLRNLSRHILC